MPIHLTAASDIWQWRASGENPCKSTIALNYQICQNHTMTRYVRITRRTPVDCSSFTLKAANAAVF